MAISSLRMPSLTGSLEAQILDFVGGSRVAEGSKDSKISGMFLWGANFLRHVFPNPNIKRIATVIADVINYRIIPVCFNPMVRSVSFVVAGSIGAPQALILVPTNWVQLFGRDPITQLGAVVFAGSQAVDYVSEQFCEQEVLTRASAYEAEYINTVRGLVPDWDLCPYHTKLLEDFPEGIATPQANKILYNAKPLMVA